MENHDEVLEFDLQSNGQGERTGMLIAASVLSWIMGGLMVLGCGFMFLGRGILEKALIEKPGQFDANQREMIQFMMDNFNRIFLVYFVAYIVSIVAVIFMYRLKKIGFYIYAPLHIFLTFYPYTYQPFTLDGGSIFSVIILGAFIAFYGVNLKHMD